MTDLRLAAAAPASRAVRGATLGLALTAGGTTTVLVALPFEGPVGEGQLQIFAPTMGTIGQCRPGPMRPMRQTHHSRYTVGPRTQRHPHCMDRTRACTLQRGCRRPIRQPQTGNDPPRHHPTR